MAKIGEYRLRIYDLLYEKPICEYAEIRGNKKQSNVLILGTGWIGNEAFKAAFWASQALDTELSITVASQNAAAYKEQVLSTKAGACMPALKLYAEQKHYANLRFVDIDVEKGMDSAGLAPLDFAANRYNYIIISLGDAEHNWLAASELITQISGAQAESAGQRHRILVNVFNELSDSISTDEQEMLIEAGRDNGIEVHFFGNESVTGTELDRIARNINFSYSMKYDQRINKKDADDQFEASRVAEFVESPKDYEIGDISIAANFIGANYAADSSFASAVHIPVKLAMCKNVDIKKAPVDTLKEAIRKKNKLYWSLVALEHRRWNAYTVTRGFRAPTPKEEETLLYQNGNTHQDKQRLLHMCLCDCGTKASLANDFDHQYDLWIRKKCPANDPSELDRASLRAHQLTKKLSSQVDIEAVLHLVVGNSPEYSNLRRAISKLANDDDNSLVLYQKSLDAAREYALSISSEEADHIEEVNKILSPIKTRNARMDFFSLDEQLVEMLPFALWYGKKYGTVITLSDGMTTSTYDVIIPTLFCAQNAVFIGKAVNSRKYQNAIAIYFESRGNNTVPEFITLSSMDVESIFACLEEQLIKYGHHDIIINCVPNRGYDAALAIGRLMEKYTGNINAVQYLQNKGIVSFSADKNVGVGLDNKNFSLAEYIQLMGGRIANEYAGLYDSSEYESIMALFKKYCEPTHLKGANGKASGSFNTWAAVTKFFSQAAKDMNYGDGIKQDLEGDELHYTGSFSETIFRNSMIGNVLEQLQTYHIIRDYEKNIAGPIVTVDFEYVNPEIGSLLQQFEMGQITETDQYKSLKFIPMNGGLKVSSRLVQQAPIVSSEETEVHRKVKLAFLQDLLQRRYIENLQFNTEDDTVTFAFSDAATMRLMKTQGLIFELIVYYLMRESGKYDDVETGVKIAWDAEDTPQEQKLIEMLDRKGPSCFGYSEYVKARGEVIKQAIIGEGESVKNEIDIIALSGMNATMVSCKTSDNDNMQWVYEIRAVSDHFQSKGVLAVSSDYRNKGRAAFVERANQMNVTIWGTETLWNSNI
ncbi:MAG TPA: hypothetical protein IAA26_14300 [Candidatus Blautia faecipullorum]|nr:hypothetical protein [Candidatus Blautia faecipullorum]